jgi:hypothetical protein
MPDITLDSLGSAAEVARKNRERGSNPLANILEALGSYPGLVSAAQSFGVPAQAVRSLDQGMRPAFEEAGKLQHYGNEYYDAGPVTLQALGAVGAPVVGPAQGLATLGAGAMRRAAPVPSGVLTAAERAAPHPGAQFPQYALEYPPVGPPVTLFDEAKGKDYLSRAALPEVEAFMKARSKIQGKMQKEGYTPYYDPAQRFDAPTQYYPGNVDTSAINPAKQATIDKHLSVIGSEETRKRLQDAYAKGVDLGDPKDWYMMGQLEADFVKELGAKEGRKAFGDRFATGMAATTAGQAPEGNLLASSFANFQRGKGRELPSEMYNVPYPVPRGKYGVVPNLEAFQKFQDRGGLSALDLDNPKRHDFAFSIAGQRRMPVMDEQMVKGMTPTYPSGPKDKYGMYSRVATEEAEKLGIDPRTLQEVAWHGFKDMEGKPLISFVNDAIERTHRLTGMPRDEILKRGIIRNEIPVYSGAAPVPTSGDNKSR